MIRKALCAAAATLALCAAAAPAAALTQVSDGSFETQGAAVLTYCYFGSDCAVGGAWTGSNGGGLQDETNGAWPGASTPDGAKYAFIQNLGEVDQTFVANDTGTYALSWSDAGRPSGCCAGNQQYSVTINGTPIGFGSTVTDQPFGPHTSNTFGLVAGTSYTIQFQGLSTGPDNTAFIDAVGLHTAVPEPATWAMMIVGFGGIGAMIRNRRRQPLALAA